MGRLPKNIVALTGAERALLEKGTRSGDWSARTIRRAQVLLLADKNGPESLIDKDIGQRLRIPKVTVVTIRQRYATDGIESIFDKPRSGRPRKFDARDEANVTKMACSEAPEGQARWTLRLMKEKLVELDLVESVSHESVRSLLKKTNSSLG